MNWLAQLIDALRKSVLYSMLESLAPFDWFVLVALVIGILYGGRKGFGDMLGKVVGMAAVSVVVLACYASLGKFLLQVIVALPNKVAEALAFLILTVITWVFVFWILGVFGKFIKVEVSGILKFFGGLFLGALFVVLLSSFIAQFFLFLPENGVKWIYNEGHSYTGAALSKVAPKIQRIIFLKDSQSRQTTKIHPA